MTATSFNHFPAIANNLEKSLKRVVKKVSTDMVKNAKDLAPVDTGFLRDSIYSTGWWGSDYGEATAHTTVSKKPKSQFKTQAYLTRDVFPEEPAPSDELTAIVAVAATYGIFLEYGTVHMAAQPFWHPAITIANVQLDGELAIVAARLGATVSGSVEDI